MVHIREAIDYIESKSVGRTVELLTQNLTERLAPERALEIIGEAANALPRGLRSQYATIEWEKVVRFRNVVSHEYFGLDYNMVWSVISERVPELKPVILLMISDQEKQLP